MKITRATDFAVRLLRYLAENGQETTTKAIAKEIDVPQSHLVKIVHLLARNKMLITRKGKGGGLKLAVSPDQITLAKVVEVIEGPLTISDCILHKKSCRFSGKCKMRKCLYSVRYKIEEILSKTTIEDLVLEPVGLN